MNEQPHDDMEFYPPKWDIFLLEYLKQRHRLTPEERHVLLCVAHEAMSPMMPHDHDDEMPPLPPPVDEERRNWPFGKGKR